MDGSAQMEKHLQHLLTNGLSQDLFAHKDQHIVSVNLTLDWTLSLSSLTA